MLLGVRLSLGVLDIDLLVLDTCFLGRVWCCCGDLSTFSAGDSCRQLREELVRCVVQYKLHNIIHLT